MNNRNMLRLVQLTSSAALIVISVLFPTVSFCQEPEKVSLCELQKDVDAYNHKLIEVTAFVSHGFEDFTLFDPTCNTWPAVLQRSEEHTSELQSHLNLVCRLLLEKKK